MAGKNFPVYFVLGTTDNGAAAKFAKSTAGMRAAAQRLTGAGKALTLGVTVPMIGMGVASGKVAATFEKEMSNVATLIDTNKESIAAMGDEVLKIGRRTPVALSSMTEALFDIRSAGISAADQFIVLEKSAQLGVAGLGSTKEAADIATSAINAFSLKGAEAERVYDLIFKTTKNGKTTISALAQGFGGVAGTVAASGTALDEYLSSVAALTTTGLPAAQAHTQLKAVISGLTRETEKSKKVFEALGAKNLPELIRQSGGLVPALRRITKELKEDDARILELVGSTEALNAVFGLTGAQAKKQEEALASMRDGSDALAEAFQKQTSASAAKFQKMQNTIQASTIKIGNALLPLAEQAAEKLAVWAKKFDNLDGETKKWIAVVGLGVAALGPLLLVTGTAITVFQTLKVATIAHKVALVAWKAVVIAARVAVLAFRGALLMTSVVTSGALLTSLVALKVAIVAKTAALWASLPAIGAAAASVGALLAPIAAVTAAIGALVLAWKKWNDLDKDLEGSGGISGTVSAMAKRGTLDPFEAHDAVLNEKAVKESRERRLAVQQQQLKANESRARIEVDFSGMPKGVRAHMRDLTGNAEVDMSTGYTLPPGGL
jgi:TP901 family phage tail tape measure protein